MISNEELLKLKKDVFESNKYLFDSKLAIHTWGNVSAISSDRKFLLIKPSGVAYDFLTFEDITLVEIDSCKTIDSKYNPSSDTPTHCYLYQKFPEIVAIVHTHSTHAVAWAQAGRDIPCYGTTHADNFYGSFPCLRELNNEEINSNYELNTGKVIVEEFSKKNLDYKSVPGTLVHRHGPFLWSTKSSKEAVEKAVTLEEIAKMAILTEQINPNVTKINDSLKDVHYFRKHGKNAYYGQKKLSK